MNLGKLYVEIRFNLWGFLVRDYIIFYYVYNVDIFIVWIVSGYGNLDILFSEDSNV